MTRSRRPASCFGWKGATSAAISSPRCGCCWRSAFSPGWPATRTRSSGTPGMPSTTFERRSLAAATRSPRGPSTVAAPIVHERLTALAEEHLPEVDELRNRAMRQRSRAGCSTTPCSTTRSSIDGRSRATCVRQRGALVQPHHGADGPGRRGAGRGHRDGRPDDELTDVRMPEHRHRRSRRRCCSPSTSPARRDGTPVPSTTARAGARLARQHRVLLAQGRGRARRRGGTGRPALERLVALQLVAREPGAVRAAARARALRVAEPT